METIVLYWPAITGLVGYAAGCLLTHKANRQEARLLRVQVDALRTGLEILVAAAKQEQKK